MNLPFADPDEAVRGAAIPVTGAETDGAAVKIHWADGRTAAMHPLWLRDNCRCGDCHHPLAWEKTSDILAIDGDVRAVSAVVEADDRVRVGWSDGHAGSFSGQWLRRHATDDWARRERGRRLEHWTAEQGARLPGFEHAAVMAEDAALAAWLGQLRSKGVALVRGVPLQDDALFRLAERIAFLRQTNFGVDFWVVSRPDPNNVAYTAIDLKSHSDLPNVEVPPGIQFFHCLEFSATGGESLLVDGFAAADELQRRDPDAFHLLSSVPVDYRFHDADWDLRWRGPIIRLDGDGAYEEIRFSRQLEAPPGLDGDTLVRLHKAKQAFARILRDPAFEVTLRLDPGDVLSFHNRRVLHGRAAFDPSSGARRFHGCYVDCDEAWSRLRVLEARLAADTVPLDASATLP